MNSILFTVFLCAVLVGGGMFLGVCLEKWRVYSEDSDAN